MVNSAARFRCFGTSAGSASLGSAGGIYILYCDDSARKRCSRCSADISEGLRQALLAAGGVQWLGVFVLASICLAQRRGYGYLLIVTCLEIVKGFTGYFSDFRLVFFVLLVAIFWRGQNSVPGECSSPWS